MGNIEFTGRRYQDDEVAHLNETIEGWHRDAREPMEGELAKTEQEVRLLETINTLIGEEVASLGIEGYAPISLEQVHILPDEAYLKAFPGEKEARGFYLATADAVYVNAAKIESVPRTLYLLIHELIHRASKQRFYVDPDDRGISEARIGYRLRSEWKAPERVQRFRGFNEMMVDITAYRILKKNQSRLNDTLGVTNADIESEMYSYTHYTPVLNAIIKRIAANSGSPAGEIFLNLLRGQFEDNILVLKEVERSCGKDALEVLSYLGTIDDKEKRDKLDGMIQQFFEAPENAQEEIKTRIREFVADDGPPASADEAAIPLDQN